VASRLERRIADGEFVDGSRLPPERDLAAMLEVSRSSIREAVRELWLKGLVDRRQGQGTYVRIRDGGRDSYLRHVNSRLGEPELTIVNVLDYRAALEPADGS
jgi:GntR family transcriptional repressor for pyruvate dehydrogenase complex